MQTLKGYVGQIIYTAESGYTVFTLITADDEVKCAGNVGTVSPGETIEVDGETTVHPKYYDQFSVNAIRSSVPDTEIEIERYLGSGAIKGIGEALAKRIVKQFGSETFKVIDEEPERLSEVRGISMRMAQEIGTRVFEKRDTRKAMTFLQQYGISNEMGIRIFKRYGQDIYNILRDNPYQLADDISGIGFRTADEIAVRAGMKKNNPFRIASGILYVLSEAGSEGNCYLPKELLISDSSVLLGASADDAEEGLRSLAIDHKVIIKQHEAECRVYSPLYYSAELGCARMLHDLDIHTADSDTANERVDARLSSIEKEFGIPIDDLQKKALRESIRNGVLILTGGPGTGKTTTVRILISYYVSEGLDVMLAAPIGRAAKRMTEATGYEAKTIHRLLEVAGDSTGEDSTIRFGRNENTPLEADVIIIDETSMVDIFLMQSLLRAIMPGTRLVLVGDADQLPSVGPGQVLKDIISSGRMPLVTLENIFRQTGDSDIVNNAHRINHGEAIKLDNKSDDFFFMERNDVNVIYKHIVYMASKSIPKYYSIDPYDVQILTPMRKGSLGVETLNGILQNYLNPPDGIKKEFDGNVMFREGDKVMQNRNDYQIEWEIKGEYDTVVDRGTGVFNGDIGIIRKIDTYESEITVEFDEHKCSKYPYAKLDEIELAYAITIHKSQGSEYPVVILPLLSGPQVLMTRNLLYTAITRAKKCVMILGSRETVNGMIDNVSSNARYTGLCDDIKEIYALDDSIK